MHAGRCAAQAGTHRQAVPQHVQREVPRHCPRACEARQRLERQRSEGALGTDDDGVGPVQPVAEAGELGASGGRGVCLRREERAQGGGELCEGGGREGALWADMASPPLTNACEPGK